MKPGSKEWHEAREKLLSASDFAAACGLNPYCSRQQLWKRKVNKTRIPDNERMMYGREHEKDAIDAYESITGNLVTSGALCTNARYPSLGCTPDGFLEGLTGVLEVKAPFGGMYTDIPIYYLTQIVGQIEITGMFFCHFVAWRPEETKIWQINGTSQAWEWMLSYLNEMLQFIGNKEKPPRFRNKPDKEEFKKLINIERIYG